MTHASVRREYIVDVIDASHRGRASDVSFVASNSMFHDPELSVWNVMGSSPNKVSPCTSLSSLPNLTSTTGMLTVCLLVMMHEKSSNAFMGARLLMDRAHEYDRLDEAFLADLRLILIATYLKNTAKICTKISLSGESPIITS